MDLTLSYQENINLTLNNGTLTLLVGSIIYYPDGNSLKRHNITTERTHTSSSAGKRLVFTTSSGVSLSSYPISSCFFRDTAPSGTGSIIWYDTANNLIKRSTNGGSTWQSTKMSFPLCSVTVASSKIQSIDEVFNGFGYMGDGYFAFPEVVGLCPMGFDEDGNPQYQECKTNNLIIAKKTSEYPYLKAVGSEFTGISFGGVYNYQENANLFIDNKKLVLGMPLTHSSITANAIEIIPTKLISQYANSERILKLANGIRTMLSNAKLIKDWYNIVYNLKTATGWGLDIWGKILNQGRSFTYVNQSSGVETNYYLQGELTVDGTTFTAKEVEEVYRKVLFMKVISLISNSTDRTLNELLQFYFNGRRVYVIQYGTMKLRYVFEVPVNKLEKSIFTSGLLPKPTGVGATFEYLPKGSYFGFFIEGKAQDEQYWAPFDNKPFYW